MYMYGKLREALFGKNGKEDAPAKDWSPNKIKTIVITGKYIFIAYHTSSPKVVALDANEVLADIQGNGSSGSLNNLLKKRQLSCLEEFYADVLFRNCRGLLDVQSYIDTLVNSACRLRYYGECQGIDPAMLQQKYNVGAVGVVNNFGYAMATDKDFRGMITAKSTGISDWYKKYNLRPDFYSVDSPDGILAKYLEKVKKQGIAQESVLEGRTRDTLCASLVVADLSSLEMYENALTLLTESDKIVKRYQGREKAIPSVVSVRSMLAKSIEVYKGNVGKRSLWMPAGYWGMLAKSTDLQEAGMPMLKRLFSVYNKFGVVCEGGKEDLRADKYDVGKLREMVDNDQGFLSYSRVLMSTADTWINEVVAEKSSVLVSLMVVCDQLGVKASPDMSGLKDALKNWGSGMLFNVLAGLCGSKSVYEMAGR